MLLLLSLTLLLQPFAFAQIEERSVDFTVSPSVLLGGQTQTHKMGNRVPFPETELCFLIQTHKIGNRVPLPETEFHLLPGGQTQTHKLGNRVLFPETEFCFLPYHTVEVLKGCVRYPLSSYKEIWNSHIGTLSLYVFWHMVQYYEIAGKAVSLHSIKLHVCHVAYITRGSKELVILCTNSTVRLKQ
jgi:hypothetical protein